MPKYTFQQLGINRQQAESIFSGLSREEAMAKAESLMAQNAQNQSQVETFTDKINKINDAYKSSYKSMAVGSERNPFAKEGEGFLGRRLYGMTPVGAFNQMKDFFTGGKKGFISSIQQLTNKETLDKLISVKQAGGTFGSLTEKELDLLINAATRIGSWEKTDKNGKVIGYDIGEGEFNKELETLYTLANKMITKSGGISPAFGAEKNSGSTSSGVRYQIVQ